MQRRKFIAGLGSLAAAGAAGIGTGAFTSVEADRSLAINTAGDANAFLAFSRASDGDGNVYPNAQEYVEGDLSTKTFSIDFTNSDDTDGSASGINQNAKTIFDNLLDITNNGTQDVNLWIESDLIASNGGVLGIYAEGELGVDGDDGEHSFHYNDDTPNKATLSPGDSLKNIGIYIPKGHSTGDLSGGTLTVIAERVGGNQD
ncbi:MULTISPECIES: hypothetical protein [Halobacterium]|uniref:hypothetical protein n=1 Tax=Halobacterium TaxID=2239 RepID=UPI00073EFF8A|nr:MULTISPECIES: hypothetical protein [Halobacterium]MCG1004316.1 hypothetical protein [Halobacterium noricense]